MAANNRLWAAERIRGELLKVGITVAKRTIQRYMRRARSPRPRGQTRATFLRTHANDIWACDFLQVHDVFFRPLFAFLITELGSRRIVHVGVTRSPTDAWVAQQLREVTAFGTAPRYLIRDNDANYGRHFDTVAVGSAIEVLRTPIKAPRANAICERLLGSVRRECLDHVLILGEGHLRRVLNEYGVTTTIFERALAALPLATQRWIGCLLFVVPAASGVALALIGLRQRRDQRMMAAIGLVVNALFGLFITLVLLFAG